MTSSKTPTNHLPTSSSSSNLSALLEAVNSGDDTKAEEIVHSLDIERADELEAVLALLESDQPDHRWWAVRALAVFDEPAAWDALILSLSDTEAAVRQCAALGLRLRPTPSAIPMLIACLGDEDPLVCRLAADALIAIGPIAIPLLDQSMQSQNQITRIEAARALAGIRNPQAIPALVAALKDSSSLVVHWAEQGLEWLGMEMLFFKP
jgi:HEAT repeat protein